MKALFSEKNRLYVTLSFLSVFLLIGMAAVQYTLLHILHTDSANLLMDRSFSQAQLVENRIQNTYSTLDTVSLLITDNTPLQQEKLEQIIQTDPCITAFEYLGAVTVQGEPLYGASLPTADSRLLTDTFRGKKALQFLPAGKLKNTGKALLFSVPLWHGDKVAGAVYGVLTDDNIVKLLSSATLGNDTVLCLSSNFDNIFLASPPTAANWNIVSDVMNSRYENKLSDLFQRLYYHGYGVTRLEYHETDYYMSAAALPSMSGWYIASIIPANPIDAQSKRVLFSLSIVYLLLAIMFLVAFYTIDRNESRNRARITRLAYEDTLTGLMNWAKMQADFSIVPLRPPQIFILFDIDEFSSLNSIMGRDYGDELLKGISRIISALLLPQERLCRIQGDQFAFCLNNRSQWTDRLHAIHNKIEASVKKYPLSLSFGVCLIDKKTSLVDAYEKALMALKNAKQHKSEKEKIVVYDKELEKELHQNKNLEREFPLALARGDMKVFLQPKYDLKHGGWAGAEALARWFHPQYGLISPGLFIPILEDNGMIADLDRYMLEQCCQLIRKWLDQGKEVHPISVNLSRPHFADTNLRDTLIHIVKKYNVPLSLLELEITERAILNDNNSILEKLLQLHDAGFHISIDDFGTGYSSLSCLEKMPLSIIKLDKSFIHHWMTQRNSRLIPDIVTMARHIGLTVLIEGVETEEQRDMVQQAGCDIVQGFYYARPMAVPDYEKKVFGEEDKSCEDS